MKTIIRYLSLIIGLFTIATMGSCDAEKDLKVIELDDDVAIYEQIYILGFGANNNFDSKVATPMEKTSNPNVFTYEAELRYYQDNKQFKFCTSLAEWNENYYIIPESGIVSGMQFAYASFGEEQPNKARICSELTGDLDDHFWGIHEGEDGIYKITLNVKDMEVTVELVEALGEKELELPTLFMVGDATPAGWDIENPTPMEMVSKDVFRYEGTLNKGEMKCPIHNDGNWGGEFLMPAIAGTVIDKNGVADPTVEYMMTGSPDNKWKVEERGKYEVVIDASKGKKAMTIAVTYLGEPDPDPELYMLGSAAGAWDSADGLQMDSKDGNSFSWEGEIVYNGENKQFKFCTSKGPWDQVEFLVPENANADGYIEVITPGTYKMQRCSQSEGTLKDAFFGIPEGESAIYKITVDVRELTVTLEKLRGLDEPEFTELYMQGVAGDTGCDSNSPGVQLSYDETIKRFVWEGDLIYTEKEGNRQFNFINMKGDWDKVTFLVPEAGDSDSYRELVSDGGVYKMKKLRGPGNPLSASWGIAEENNGKYRIEVDAESLTLYVKKL